MRFTSWFHWIHGNINATNLAGAVDIVVVKKLDGTLIASPFYVRFGKLDVLNSEGKQVYVHVNGVLSSEIQMILSDQGHAYFVEKCSKTEYRSTRISKIKRTHTRCRALRLSNKTQAIKSPIVLEDSLTRCQSDSDLDKRYTSEATFFLTAGRKAISEIDYSLEYEEEPLDDTSFVLRHSHSTHFEDEFIQNSACNSNNEPFVFTINSRFQALCYLSDLSVELNKICCFSNEQIDYRTREDESGISITTPCTGLDILGDVSLSTCGHLGTKELTNELFDKYLITNTQFLSNPNLLYDDNLVIRINNQYYNWKTAAPMIVAASFFQQRLEFDEIDKLVEKYMPTKAKQPSASWWIFGGGWSNNKEKVPQPEPTVERRIHLSSEELQSLNLDYGENEITFSVVTALQGTSVVAANIFLYDETDKFIISDIDGTITRSDVIGQILPLVGRDWSHDGIAEFFCAIEDNGYKFIYVSSRSIGQSALTKGYIRNLSQQGFGLPRGPILLSPDSLLNALYREVVTRKPEEFKIDCLKTIASLFSSKVNPFYAGFGNRVNDQWAYTSVGIPLQRIFTINPSGVVSQHSSDYGSYVILHEVVDQLFPPVFKSRSKVSFFDPQNFSYFTYWRDDLAENDDLI